MKKTTAISIKKIVLFLLLILFVQIPLFTVTADASADEPITTFEDLKAAITAATGTADDPVEIYISGMIKQNEKLTINNGQYIHLIGVGEGENGLIRESVFSGDMIDVGSGNNSYVCGLILDNIVLDGGAVWEDGAGSTNSGINAGNSSIVSVRQKASLTIDGGTILRNNCKSGGGSGVFLRGKMEIINGSVLNNATTGSNNGGGILMRDSTTELILGEQALISGNHAGGDGGGIFQQSGGTLTIKGAKINNNSVANGKSGGAIFTKGSNAKVYVNSGEMTGNIAGNSGSAIR
ncbi:MAG: hypothetical protein IJX97_01860 [Clostridia bacterium]|nr:hypothetical protein [Clostridia bacterium]